MSKKLNLLCIVLAVMFLCTSLCIADDQDRQQDQDRKKDSSCQTDLTPAGKMPELAADQDRKRDSKKDGSCQR